MPEAVITIEEVVAAINDNSETNTDIVPIKQDDFTKFARTISPQTRKNYTTVVHYENDTASISDSNYVWMPSIYMNVVTLMNPK